MKFSKLEIELLQKIHSLALKIEKESKDQDFNEALLSQLTSLLFELRFSKNPDLERLAELPDHLHPQMTLRHFVNFMIPIERLLDRNLQDDQFLISTEDQIQNQSQTQQQKFPLFFVLDNIRSAFNVGSVFRLADCVGASEIILCGYTVGPENEALKKTSMSATQFVKSRHCETVKEAIEILRNQGIFVIGLETGSKALPLYQGTLKGPTAFVVGNERFGLDRSTLNLVDEVRKIPVFGVKNSLNVSNSLAIAAYEWSRQNV
ncbi:MAG: hypothetical protein BroJett040_11210 [Oligoflexia bacterium]|nr:MAG: hypothetical protein BroJett040_11210 [Oligoflexia bacterium]